MMKCRAVAVLTLGVLATVPALAQDDLLARARRQFQPLPAAAPELPGNPASPAKVELGKALYFDPRLSASHAISCASCHNIGLGARLRNVERLCLSTLSAKGPAAVRSE